MFIIGCYVTGTAHWVNVFGRVRTCVSSLGIVFSSCSIFPWCLPLLDEGNAGLALKAPSPCQTVRNHQGSIVVPLGGSKRCLDKLASGSGLWSEGVVLGPLGQYPVMLGGPWGAGDGSQVQHMQGMCPTVSTVSPAPCIRLSDQQ